MCFDQYNLGVIYPNTIRKNQIYPGYVEQPFAMTDYVGKLCLPSKTWVPQGVSCLLSGLSFSQFLWGQQQSELRPEFRSMERLTPPLPPLFFAFYSKYHVPIPENALPCKPFCCGCPYEKKSKNLVLLPLRAFWNISPKTVYARVGLSKTIQSGLIPEDGLQPFL